jgi:hypothetical protein
MNTETHYRTKKLDWATAAYMLCEDCYAGVEIVYNPDARDGRGGWDSYFLFSNPVDVKFQVSQYMRDTALNCNYGGTVAIRNELKKLSKQARDNHREKHD